MAEKSNKLNEIWVNRFDEETATEFRSCVMLQSKLDPSRPIFIYIDSYGGYVDALAKMIETLDEIPNPVVTVCMGKAMSCGAILLSHGDLRFCGKHSRVMIHEVSSGTSGDVHEMHADVQETKRLNEHFMGLLAKNCGYSGYPELRKMIKEQDGRDRYLNAEAALEFGIVDVVGLPKLNVMGMYEIAVANPKHKALKTKQPKQTPKKHKTPSKVKNNKKIDSKKTP